MFVMQKVTEDFTIEGFNSIYYFEFSKDFQHDPEQHDFWEMVYVDSGSVNAITNGVGCTLSQGQVIFHEPMDTHAHVSDKRAPNAMMVVSFTASGDIMKYFGGKTFTLDKTSRMLLSLFLEEARNALGEIPSDYNDRRELDFSGEKFGSSQLLKCHFTEFLIKLIRIGNEISTRVEMSKKSRDLANNSMCELMCDYMKQNIYANLTLGEICTHFHMGKTQLCEIFREYTGMAPMEFYHAMRISRSKMLLREKQYSVSQISDMLGYSSIHTYSRAFKKATGLSPMAYSKTII